MESMSFKFKTLRKAALLSAVTLLIGFTAGTVAFAYDHSAVPLRDAAGKYIADISSANLTNAYSSKETCGACHDYDAIEQHSYHTQLASNEYYGWDPMNPDGDVWEAGAGPQGKSWVQGQGHVGAW
jgi:hypothetical protein